MGAVVAAATHAPITAIIMIFELTQSITIIPPLMAACVVSTLVTTYLHRDSIYTMKLTRRGIETFRMFDDQGGFDAIHLPQDSLNRCQQRVY